MTTVGHRCSRLRDFAEYVHHESGGGCVIGRIRQANPESLPHLTYWGGSIDDEGAIREPRHKRRDGFALFSDLADDLFKHVLQGHEADESSVFVNDKCQVLPRALKLP